MKALRIKLRQASASYACEETVNNKTSYTLPPFSTVIGAIHNACGYREYKQMKISVQGKYLSSQREVYVNHGLIDNLHDDRGILIWLPDPDSLNTGFVSVAKALNGTGNSFKNRVTINVLDEIKLEEYSNLYRMKETLDEYSVREIKPQKERLKERETLLKEMGKVDKSSAQYKAFSEEVKAEKEVVKRLEEEFEKRKWQEYDEPRSHFKTLTKGPQTWEVLYDVELVLHVQASDEVLKDILEHRNDLVCLGRSEDFIDLLEMKLVELTDKIDDEYRMLKDYSIYVNVDRMEDETYFKESKNEKALGTVYYVSKEYRIEKNSRVFNRIPCLLTSNLAVDADSSGKGVYLDQEGDITYLVDLN